MLQNLEVHFHLQLRYELTCAFFTLVNFETFQSSNIDDKSNLTGNFFTFRAFIFKLFVNVFRESFFT